MPVLKTQVFILQTAELGLTVGSPPHLRARADEERSPKDKPPDVSPPGDSPLIRHSERRNSAEKLQEEPIPEHEVRGDFYSKKQQERRNQRRHARSWKQQNERPHDS